MQFHFTIDVPDRLVRFARRTMTRRAVSSLLILGGVVSTLAAYAVTLPHTFTSGTTASSTQVNANFTALKSAVDALEGKGQWDKNGSALTYTSGNVGIGTANPGSPLVVERSVSSGILIKTTAPAANAELWLDNSVQQYRVGVNGGAGNGFLVYDGTAGVTRLKITPSGNTGIGTDVPGVKLHVATGTQDDGLRLSGASNYNSWFLTNLINGAFNNITQVNDRGIFWGGATIDNPGGGFVIAPWRSGTSGIRLDANGNVGIGTASPSARFHVSGPASGQVGSNLFENTGLSTDNNWIAGTVLATKTTDMGNGFGSSIGFAIKDDAGVTNVIGAIGANKSGTDDTGDLVFFPRLSGAASERMRITATGNVGIGTTAPSQRLEVSGGLRLNTAAAKPTCDTTLRGTFWITQAGAGVKDNVEVCAKDATDAYAWRVIY